MAPPLHAPRGTEQPGTDPERAPVAGEALAADHREDTAPAGSSSRRRSLAVLLLVVALAAGVAAWSARRQASPPPAGARSVVIDTDMSVDDWMAILFLLQQSDVSVKAITVSGTGVAHGPAGARNAIRLLDLAGRRDIPVAYGRATTYPGGRAFPQAWRPAVDAMLGIDLPQPSRAVSRLSAAKLIAQVAAESPVEILELGPPTNVADALRATPALGKQVAAVTLMSGALSVDGNAPGHEADWNFYVDPAAADIVLRSGIPWTLVPLDATNAVPYNEPFFERLGAQAKTAAARFVHEALSRQMPGEALSFWDPFAAAVLVDQSVATLERRTIRVLTSGADAGRTVEAQNGTAGRVALAAKQERFERLFLGALNTPAGARPTAGPRPNAAWRWTNTGPEGGPLQEVAIHPRAPRVVYARSGEAGLFQSTDGGRSWRRPSSPDSLHDPDYLEDIALHPADPQTVYALGGALHRTRDGGASWAGLFGTENVPCPGSCPNLFLVAASPASPRLIYGLSYESNSWTVPKDVKLEHPGVWLWSSADAGASWKPAGRIEAAGELEPWRSRDARYALLVDPLQRATVYVQVPARGVFRSEDGGKTWAEANAGLPAGKLSTLAVDPARSGVLYAGTRRGQVFRSVDYGKRWTLSARSLPGVVGAIAVSAADGAVYAGTSPPARTDGVEAGGGAIYRSADGRTPWKRAHTGLTGWNVSTLAPDPKTSGRVLATTEHGIFVTRDGGASWGESVRGLVASSPSGLAVDPANPRVVFTAVERGVAVSHDGGETWRVALDVRSEHARVGPLLAVPGKPATIYAVKQSLAAPRVRSTLLASRNSGRTWTTVGVLPAEVAVLVADPSSPTTLYAVRGYAGSPRGGTYKSIDGGRSWSQIYSASGKQPASALVVDPLNPRVLYVGLGPTPDWNRRGSALLKSEDGGRSWRRLDDFGPGMILALAADPRRRGTLYAVRFRDWTEEVRVSRDGGRTWANLGRSRADLGALLLLVDPVRPDVVYVGSQDGILVHEGRSSQWRKAGPPTGGWVRSLAVDSNGRRLYAGIAGGGVAATRLPARQEVVR